MRVVPWQTHTFGVPKVSQEGLPVVAREAGWTALENAGSEGVCDKMAEYKNMICVSQCKYLMKNTHLKFVLSGSSRGAGWAWCR